jgi:predicted nucleotidyltransferase
VRIEQAVREHIEDLIVRKQASREMGMGNADPILNAFIEKHLARWNTPTFAHNEKHEMTKQLNALLREMLNLSR